MDFQRAVGGFEELLGLEFLEISGDRVVLTLPVRPNHHQPHGIVHGGVYCALVETATSVAAAHWYAERGRVVGVSNHTDFLRATREGTLTTTATPIHRGRLQQLWVAEIVDQDGRLVARGEVRIQNLSAADAPADRG